METNTGPDSVGFRQQAQTQTLLSDWWCTGAGNPDLEPNRIQMLCLSQLCIKGAGCNSKLMLTNVNPPTRIKVSSVQKKEGLRIIFPAFSEDKECPNVSNEHFW